MLELVINRGVPGSGKSTFAMKWILSGERRVRSNRDDIRKSHFGVYYGPPINEGVVTQIQHAGIRAALSMGYSVIVDDCNIDQKYINALAKIGYEFGADVSIKLHDVELDVAIQRNQGRERFVPVQVIEAMHSKLQDLKDVQLPERR